jgi:hypothetical protein
MKLVSAFVLVGAMSLAARSASATVEIVYPASKCVPASNSDVGKFSIGANGSLTATADGVHVICPVPKTTSGPNVSGGDKVNYVEIFRNNVGQNLPFRCATNVYFTTVNDLHQSNTVARSVKTPLPGAIGAQMVPSPVISAYWWDNSSWFYVELDCNLNNGQGFATYTVSESGTNQTARIFPASSCSQTANGFPPNFFASTGFNMDAAGFAESPGGAATDFQCLVPTSVAQFALARSGNDAGFGINSTDGPFVKQTGSTLSGVGVPAFPTAIYPSATLPAMSPMTTLNGFLNTNSFWNVFIKQLHTLGDSALLSYRTN